MKCSRRSHYVEIYLPFYVIFAKVHPLLNIIRSIFLFGGTVLIVEFYQQISGENYNRLLIIIIINYYYYFK